MDTFFTILKNVIIFVVLAMPGYILVKIKILKSTDATPLSKLLTTVGMPFLILSGTLQVEFNANFVVTAGVSSALLLIVLIFMFFASIPLTSMEKNLKNRGMMRFSTIFPNNGFLGIPLAMAVFFDNPNIIAILIIMNLVQNIITIDVGAYLIAENKPPFNIKKLLFNPILIAFIIGLILNLTGAIKEVPEIQSFSDHLKNIVTPISMTILGMNLANVKFTAMFTNPKTYYVSILKLILMPVIGVTLAFACASIFSLSNDIIIASFIAFAMPTAGLASTLADQYNGDAEGAVFYTLGSTILSIATIPLLYLLLTVII